MPEGRCACSSLMDCRSPLESTVVLRKSWRLCALYRTQSASAVRSSPGRRKGWLKLRLTPWLEKWARLELLAVVALSSRWPASRMTFSSGLFVLVVEYTPDSANPSVVRAEGE